MMMSNDKLAATLHPDGSGLCPGWAVNADATIRCNRARGHPGQHLDSELGVWWAIAGPTPEGAEHGPLT